MCKKLEKINLEAISILGIPLNQLGFLANNVGHILLHFSVVF